MDIRGLAQQFIHFAANEQDKNGNRRTGPTISAYRRAMEGLIASTEAFNGGDLTTLPENFIETNWMPTQASILDKPIQVRVRVAALKLFTAWCFRNNVPCAPLTFPNIKTPPKKPKEEVAVNDVMSLGDFMQTDPVPTAATPVPQPPAQSYVTQQQAPQQAAPKQPAKPNGSGRPANPIASMLPTGQYKLRVRRERELDDPVWVADFPAERVAMHGAIEPFLGREVAPRLALQGLTGDVTFLVSAIGPNGVEGERGRITVAITPATPMPQSVAAPVVGAPVASAAPGQDIADVLSYHRRAQEELEERIAKRVEQVAKPAPVQEERRVNNRDEMDDLKRMMAQLAGSVQSLAERIEDRERDRDRDRDRFDGMQMMAQTPPPAPAAPQLDLLAVIKEVASMTNKAAPPPPPTPPQPGIMEMFSMMAQAKQMFAPAQVNVDVSPLEEQISELKQQLASNQKKKGEIGELLENMRNVKELMGLMGAQPQGKASSGLGGALGSLVEKIVNDPEPIAMAVERVLNATAAVRSATTTGKAPAPQQPAAARDPIPPQLRKTTETLLTAEGDAAIVAAGYEWITTLGNIPQTKKLAERMMVLLRGEKTNELVIYLRQILTHFGYGDKAPIDRIQTVAQTLVEQVRSANESADGDEDGDEDESDDGQPDLTVRVGGRRDEEDEEDESDDSEDDEDEGDDEEDADEDDTEADVVEQADESGDSEPEAEPVVEVAAEEPPAPKRGRGRPRKMKLTPAGQQPQPPEGEQVDPLIGAMG